MSFCENVGMLAVGTSDKGSILTRVRCKQWNCSYCAYINRVQWHMRVFRAMESNRQWDAFGFVTVTAHRNARTPMTSYKNLSTALTKALKRMRRNNLYNDMPYLRVFEPHSDGALHAHMLIHWRCSWDDDECTRWLKDTMASLGAGYIADYRTTRYQFDEDRDDDRQTQAALQVVSYVTKYMTKATQGAVELDKYPRMRMIQASQHFPPSLATNVDDYEWRVQQVYRADDYASDPKPVVDVQAKREIKLRHFDKYAGFYPDEQIMRELDMSISKY